MDTPEERAPQECGAEHEAMLKPLRIELKFRGFEKNGTTQIIEITRSKNSEIFLTPPVQQDVRRGRYGKMSLAVRFFTEGEPKFFPMFVPADPLGDTYQPNIDEVSDDRYTLTLHEGQEGVVVIAEQYGEKFQITFLDLWEPIWISSCFGDLDTITQHFGAQHRAYVMDTMAAMEYRAAEKQRAEEEQLKEERLTEQHAEAEKLVAEQKRLEENELAKERKREAVEKDTSAAQRLCKLLGFGKKEDKAG
ncbi:MAG: hypothetical protein Q7R73_03090 [bacterium]|nr:hypothetical protein [bacterium]